jgi:hypothetical protein
MNERNFRGGFPGLGWPQLATYPQSPISRPAGCCDVAYLCQHSRNPPGQGGDYG